MRKKTVTIEQVNRLAGQETLHPLVTVVRKEIDLVDEESICDFFGLFFQTSRASLNLYRPGDMFVFNNCSGVFFHPDLLIGTHLERDIEKYPKRCRCKSLTSYEQRIISDCLDEIDGELHHAIDRFTAPIIASHIGLLLDYCVRFCDGKEK